jgi:hypothetical protein
LRIFSAESAGFTNTEVFNYGTNAWKQKLAEEEEEHDVWMHACDNCFILLLLNIIVGYYIIFMGK